MRGAGFFLGTHQPAWLARLDVPLMVSHRTLAERASLPRGRGRWMLDSGAFTDLQRHGRFQTTPRAYAAAVRRYRDEIGCLMWAAIQDWMCEPAIIAGGVAGGQWFVGTGLDVAEHQRRTVRSFLELRELAPDLPWLPTIQGYARDDYHRCIDRYARAGIDLTRAPLVGLGSVCRRQATGEIGAIASELAAAGLRLHGFGVKQLGLSRYADHLESADSLAWSYHARRRPALPGCSGHRNCANCPRYALAWRQQVIAGLDGPRQLRLGMVVA